MSLLPPLELERTKHGSQRLPAHESNHTESTSQPRLTSTLDFKEPQIAHMPEQVRALPQFNPMSSDSASLENKNWTGIL